MGTGRRKFWSRRTLAYIVGMTIALRVSKTVNPLIGATDITLDIIMTAIYICIFTKVLELILTTENTT